jgi:hypothetical protein
MIIYSNWAIMHLIGVYFYPDAENRRSKCKAELLL